MQMSIYFAGFLCLITALLMMWFNHWFIRRKLTPAIANSLEGKVIPKDHAIRLIERYFRFATAVITCVPSHQQKELEKLNNDTRELLIRFINAPSSFHKEENKDGKESI